VINALGAHGCSAITALTAQNTQGVQATEAVSENMLRAQLDALNADLPPAAIKTGMLGSAATCQVLAEWFQTLAAPIICDPVLKSTSGTELLAPASLDLLIQGIFPKVALLTPNLPEARQLIGADSQTVEEAAERLLELGVASVLIKGGHAADAACRDYWTDGQQARWFSSPRIETSATHGTGCILSSAIAAAVARGQDMPDAIATAKTFLNQCLKSPANVGHGNGPMRIEPFRDDPQDRPTVVGGIKSMTPATDG